MRYRQDHRNDIPYNLKRMFNGYHPLALWTLMFVLMMLMMMLFGMMMVVVLSLDGVGVVRNVIHCGDATKSLTMVLFPLA
jgi:hypothetical protein